MLQLILLFCFFNLLTVRALACTFLPENNLAIPVTKTSSGMTEEQYYQVIDKFEARYRPILENIGKKLTIERLWEDPRVNAGTLRKGQEVIIRPYGGFARHPMITLDGYLLVLCHELGHHLGGIPKKNLPPPNWPSTEGQADYYATLKCLRKIFRDDDNVATIKGIEVPSVINEKCTLSFKTAWEKALCIRTSMAGISVAKVMAQTKREENPDVTTPDTSITETTLDTHPDTQCRLDTYFQGSICEVSSYKPVSSKDEKIGTCHPLNGHHLGNRPTCWFVPEH